MSEKLDKKFQNEVLGTTSPSNYYCYTCAYGYGAPPFADNPSKAYCMIYTRDNSTGKPKGVSFNGKKCTYYAIKDF